MSREAKYKQTLFGDKPVATDPVNNVLSTVTFELIRQGLNGERWEACEGCPVKCGPDDDKNSLCYFLGREANKVLGGFGSCGGGATWRIKQ